jgi:hypothetical protein
LPLHLGLAECALALGRPDEAREEAARLCEYAGRPAERTYLLHGRRLLAEVALAEGERKEMVRALEGLQGPDGHDAPLAQWRAEDTSWRLAEKLKRPAVAWAARVRRDELLGSLAGSLGVGHPLAECLLRGTQAGPQS